MASADAIISEIEIHVATQGAAQAAVELDKLTASFDRTSKVVESADRGLQRFAKQDALFRQINQLESAQKALNRAQQQGLAGTAAYSAAQRVIEQRQATVAMMTATGGGKTGGLAAYEAINMSRQFQDIAVSLGSGQHAMTVFMQQGVQVYDILASHQGGFTAGVKAMGQSLLGLLSPARIMGAGVVGAIAGITFGASEATNALVDLQKQAEKIGARPSGIMNANVVGARAGLTQDETGSAIANASRSFEQFKRNSGDVLSVVKQIDAGFLSTLDHVQTLPQYIDAVGNEIKKLPATESMSLAQALLGQDEGRALFNSVDELARALGKTSAPLDEAARYASDLERQVNAAAQTAHNELLASFEKLAVPLTDVKMGFYAIESAIADAMTKAGQFYNLLRSYIPDWTSKSGWLEPPAVEKGPAQTLPAIEIGASRQRYVGYDAASKASRAGGKSDAEKELEKYQSVSKELEDQIRLASSLGDAHKAVQAEIDKSNWLEKLGSDASKEHKDHIGELVDKLTAAKTAQEALNESTKTFNDAYKSVTGSVSGGLKDLLLNNGKPKDVAASFLKSMNGNIFDAAMTGSGLMAKLLNLEGKDGAVGGLFGSLASMLHLDGKAMQTQTMNVNAATVNMSGGIPGVPGANVPGVGGLFSGLGNLFQPKDGASGSGFFSGISDWLSSTFHFADGGIMGPTGPIPLRAYAGGGVANSPQLALFGEGSGPEAFIPLRGGKVPVAMDGASKGHQNPGVTVHNYAGVDVEPRITKGHVEIIVGKRVAQAMAQVPSLVADAQRRQP